MKEKNLGTQATMSTRRSRPGPVLRVRLPMSAPDIRTIRLVLRLSFVLFLILVLVSVCMGVGYDFVIGKGITPNDDEYRPGVARSCYPFSSFKKQKKPFSPYMNELRFRPERSERSDVTPSVVPTSNHRLSCTG